MPKIRSRNIEVGLNYGVLSIEDFGTHPAYGVTAAYHVTEDFFFQAEVGRSNAGQTSFETLTAASSCLPSSERRFTYYDLSLGYNFLPGEAFLGRGHAMTSAFYLIGGIGGIDFAGDTKFTVNFGAGYRVVPTDWLAVHITVQDRVFESEPAGHHQAHQQHRGADRDDRLLLTEGRIMRNRIVAIAAALAHRRAGAGRHRGRPRAAVQPRLARRQGREPGPVQGPGRDDQLLGQLVRSVPPGNAAAREHI